MKRDWAGSTYIERAKGYEEEYAKHHQKQFKEHHQTVAKQESHNKQWAISKEPIPNNENPLSQDELEYLFWNRLAPLGWKKNSMAGNTESYQLMLVCPECDTAILSQQSHTVTFDKARKMTSQEYIDAEKDKHKKKCKPTEYDENGDVIEAVSEATPEATPFEKPQEGTMRYDTIDGSVKVYIGGTWVIVTSSQPATGLDISPEAQTLLASNMNNWLDEHLKTDYK